MIDLREQINMIWLKMYEIWTQFDIISLSNNISTIKEKPENLKNLGPARKDLEK